MQDTADAAQLLYGAPPEFESWRRSVDYYPEGFLIWLEADTIIRQQTKGQKSMNDFCRIFHGGGNTPPKVITYTFDDVVKTLERSRAIRLGKIPARPSGYLRPGRSAGRHHQWRLEAGV